MAKIYDLDMYREQETPDPGDIGPKVKIENEFDAGSMGVKGESIRPDRLYPLGQSNTLDLQKALKLIAEAKSHLSKALQSMDNGDHVGSELEMQHLKPLMAELFLHRDIGDGFSTIISCIFYAINNHDHMEFTEEQLLIISFAIRKLSEDPFVGYDNSLDLTDEFEKVGFAVEPPEFEGLAEILDGESLR